MILPIQFKIKENPYYLRYLRSNSYWYKLLNRDPNNFKIFEKKVKEEYHLTKTAKLKDMIDTLDMLEKIILTLK